MASSLGNKPKDYPANGWLCGARLGHFETAPESVYIKAEPGSGRYESTEAAALRDRIEKLGQLVGRLTLENDFLKRAKDH